MHTIQLCTLADNGVWNWIEIFSAVNGWENRKDIVRITDGRERVLNCEKGRGIYMCVCVRSLELNVK